MQPDKQKIPRPSPRGELLPRCKICEGVPPRGIADGYCIRGAFICTACEEAIVRLEAGTEEYQFFMTKLKKLFT